VRRVEGALYAALRGHDAGWQPLAGDAPRVAYVVAGGLIHGGRGFLGIGSEALRALLERLRQDAAVRAVVLRLTSPGGDATASDVLWRAIRVARRDKPIVASLGDVAASGGYYLASAADAVFAEAASVTGSIGVVGGKLHFERLLAKLGMATDAVERGARAGLMSASRGFTPEERGAVRAEMQAVYDTFVDRVAEGRGLAREAVERAAAGRVWSGARARELGLVDALGGPLEALREARRLAGLRDDERAVVELHPRRPRFSALLPRPWVSEG
jgi:protease-4